jgi:hypothetical protein
MLLTIHANIVVFRFNEVFCPNLTGAPVTTLGLNFEGFSPGTLWLSSNKNFLAILAY